MHAPTPRALAPGVAADPGSAGAVYLPERGEERPAGGPAGRVEIRSTDAPRGGRHPRLRPRGSGPRRRRPLGAYGEKDTVSGISVMPLYFSIARFMRFSLWPSRLFHSAHQLRKFLKVSSSSERMPK